MTGKRFWTTMVPGIIDWAKLDGKWYQVLSKAAGKFIDALQQCCEFQSGEEKNGG